MASLDKGLLLCLVIIFAATIFLTVIPANAQTIPKPSVPEFTLKYVERSFTTVDGVYYDSKTIEVTIANQPSLNHSLFYNVKYRINNGNWKDIYTNDDAYPPQSDSDYTIILVPLHPQGNNTLVPANSILDVQVEAMIGYIHRGYNPNHTSQLDMYPYVFTGETSGWSNTQTITLSDNSVSSTPNVPEFPFILIVCLLLVGLATALMVKLETNTTINISLKRQI
jgi:hypothetical protein